MARPALKRLAVDYALNHYAIARRRACRILRQHRSVQYYRSRLNPRVALRQRMRELSQTRIRYGYRRLQVLLRREGWAAGKNLVYRLYCEEQLQLRCRRGHRRKMAVARRARYIPQRANQAWAMDFVADELVNGTKIRALTVIDVYTREALSIHVGNRLRGADVVDVCNRLVARRGAPCRLFVDNGSEFSGKLMDLWAYHHGVQIDFSRPGKPTDNGHVESFNGSLRDECLNVHWFESISDAQEKIEAWRVEYNDSRPHQALKELTPSEFAQKCGATETSVVFGGAGI
jgi:putative transposase